MSWYLRKRLTTCTSKHDLKGLSSQE